jgi:hypothetical protein
LFSSAESKNKGLRVSNLECWKKLIGYMSSIKTVDTIKLGTAPGRVDDVKIVAKIFINKL